MLVDRCDLSVPITDVRRVYCRRHKINRQAPGAIIVGSVVVVVVAAVLMP